MALGDSSANRSLPGPVLLYDDTASLALHSRWSDSGTAVPSPAHVLEEALTCRPKAAVLRGCMRQERLADGRRAALRPELPLYPPILSGAAGGSPGQY
jgi:hypothetical protein